MSGSGGVSTARPARGENRFYVSPAMRKYQQLPQQQQPKTAPSPRSEMVKRSLPEGDQCAPSSPSSSICSVSGRAVKEGSVSVVPNSTPVLNSTNLDRFLEHTTPLVPSRISPKSKSEWRNRDSKEAQSFFILGDLWEFFNEWSAYGAGIPVVLNGSDTVIQYYVPYLSGMQIYIDPPKPSSNQRHTYDTDSSSRTTTSDGGNLSNEHETSNQQGQLVFEYFEHASPFTREPLAYKVALLTSHFPSLKTYRSSELTQASWFSVAWYPIYRIPMGPTLQNLDACFLTFHSLSTPSNGGDVGATQKMQLPTFGLASYKFKASFWNPDGAYENQKVSSLLQAADNWLRLLQVNLPDYKFFVSHGASWR